MNTLDEAEYQRLQTAIGDAERILSNKGTNSSLSLGADLESKKSRSHTLEHEGIIGGDYGDRRKAETTTACAIAALVAKETNLSHQERLTYSKFLHQEHFTKANFEELDEFYQGPWGRLSADGKREMSQRFWMGVEQGEYSFEEAPKSVRDKEADQLARYTKHPEEAPEVIQRMNPQTKQNLLKAHEADDHAAIKEILSSSSSFKKDTKGPSQAAYERSDEAVARDAASDSTKLENTKRTESKDNSKEDQDFFASLETTSQVSPVGLPKPEKSETAREF